MHIHIELTDSSGKPAATVPMTAASARTESFIVGFLIERRREGKGREGKFVRVLLEAKYKDHLNLAQKSKVQKRRRTKFRQTKAKFSSFV